MDVRTTPHMAYLFPFQVRPLILLSSLLYSAVHFVKGLTKINHNPTRIYNTNSAKKGQFVVL